MSWPVGTIVMCVDDTSSVHEVTGTVDSIVGAPLVAGNHYTIRKSAPAASFYINGETTAPGVWLKENVRFFPGCSNEVDVPWGACRFRLAEGAQCESERMRSMHPMGNK